MSYTITLSPSGHTFQAEADETILEAALRQQFSFPYGCRGGACGACKGKILSGETDYDDEPTALSEAERQRDLALYCMAKPRSDLELEVKEIGAAKDIVIKTLPCRVARMEKLADDVMRLYLKLPQMEDFSFLAGQYLDILLKDGRRRSFSLANSAHGKGLLELHIRQVDNGFFTSQVFEQMREKDLLRFEGPLGSFFLRSDSDRPLIFMAGGTGFAPIKGIIEQALADGISQPMHLYWGARDPASLYLHDLAQQWAEQHENIRYTPVLSNVDENDSSSYRQGWVHQAIADDFSDLSGFDIYASGPPEMIDAGRNAFLKQGMEEDSYYFDAFTFNQD